MPSVNHDRPLRFASKIHRALSEVLIGYVIEQTSCQHLTIVHVDVSPDCRHARITLSALTEAICLKKAVAHLNDKSGYIVSLMRKKIHARYMPKLIFQSVHDIP